MSARNATECATMTVSSNDSIADLNQAIGKVEEDEGQRWLRAAGSYLSMSASIERS